MASAGLYASLQMLQTDNHASTPPLTFLQDGCPYCRSINSVKALKESIYRSTYHTKLHKNRKRTKTNIIPVADEPAASPRWSCCKQSRSLSVINWSSDAYLVRPQRLPVWHSECPPLSSNSDNTMGLSTSGGRVWHRVPNGSTLLVKGTRISLQRSVE